MIRRQEYMKGDKLVGYKQLQSAHNSVLPAVNCTKHCSPHDIHTVLWQCLE